MVRFTCLGLNYTSTIIPNELTTKTFRQKVATRDELKQKNKTLNQTDTLIIKKALIDKMNKGIIQPFDKNEQGLNNNIITKISGEKQKSTQFSTLSDSNLTPYQPFGWDNKIVLSTGKGTNTSTPTIYNNQVIYLDWAIINTGTTTITQSFYTKLYVDGVLKANYYTTGLNASYYVYLNDVPIGPLSAGSHTFKVVADANKNVVESNENDNEYTLTKTIDMGVGVNLCSYQPAGWDDKIVLSTITGTNTSTPTINDSQEIYLDWAIGNDGPANITQPFYIKLYVDGILLNDFYSDGLNAAYYTYFRDVPIGPLSAGSHVFTLVADANNNVAESNENDNEYTLSKTILIHGIPKINISPTSLTINKGDNNTALKFPSHSFVDNSKNNPITAENKVQNEITNYKMGSIIPDSVVEYWKNRKLPAIYYKSKASFATNIDWSGNDSPVKRQGECGACWAFAAIAYIENLGLQTDLSEQVVISCSNAGSCAGGNYYNALKYIQSSGVPFESCYPYIQGNGSCENSCQTSIIKERITDVSNYLWGNTTVDALKSELQNGPLVVHMLVPDDNTLQTYKSGVYKFNGTTIPETNGHAVLLVGYDDTQQCFKVKNSWGPDWGESGYFRISYDEVSSAVVFGSYAVKGTDVYTQDLTKNTFKISNHGNSNLTISSITGNKNWLSILGIKNTTFSISQTDSIYFSVAVDWSLVGATTQTGMITISSDDPEEPIISVQIIAEALTTGIELSKNNNYKIYPNPVSNEIIIEALEQNDIAKFEIINLFGQIISQGYFRGKTIVPTKNFTSGIYNVKVEYGQTIECTKIIKK